MLMTIGAVATLAAGVLMGTVINTNFGKNSGPSIVQTPSASPTVSPQISAPVAPNLPFTIIFNVHNGHGAQESAAPHMPISTTCELIPQQNETVNDYERTGPKITVLENEPPSTLENQSFFSTVMPTLINSPLVSFLQNNALPLIAGPSVCSSFYTFLFLRRAEQLLRKPAAWFNWKRNVPFEQYSSIERDEIAPFLIQSIQKRYATSQNTYDFVQPLKLFLADINHEKRKLEQFIRVCAWLEWLHVGALFGVNKVYVEQAKTSIARLDVLKRMFTGWATEQKIARGVWHRRSSTTS